ncbi:MAG TPA: hypothetical protein VIM58_12900 [Candidatus Methylacidiphilales bacterium]
MNFHQLLYSLELGKGTTWVRIVTFVVAFLGATAWYDIGNYHGLGDPQAMDNAQVARQLSRGEGYTTKVLTPLRLAQDRDRAFLAQGGLSSELASAVPIAIQNNPPTLPETLTPPLYPAVLAVVYKVTGVSFDAPPSGNPLANKAELAAVILNQFLLLGTGIVAFFLALALFDLRVAQLAGFLVLFSPILWRFSLSGLSTPLTLFLVALAALLLHRAFLADERGETGAVVGFATASAAVVALAGLSDFGALWLLPAWLCAILFLRAKGVLFLLFPLVWAVIDLPWLIRNAHLTGDLLGGATGLLVAGSGAFPGTLLQRSFHPFLANASPWSDSFHNVVHGLRWQIEQGFSSLGGALIVFFFFAGILHIFKRVHARRLRYVALIALLFLVVGPAIANAEPRLLSPQNRVVLILPLVAVFGASFFHILLDRIEIGLPLLRKSTIVLFFVLNSFPFILALPRPEGAPFHYPPYHPPMITLISRWYQPDEVIATDIPHAVAWYGDRTALWLPSTTKEFVEINDYVHPLSAILLTPESMNSPALSDIIKGEWKGWALLVLGLQRPAEIPLTTLIRTHPNENEYLLLTDRPRWPQK